MDENTNSVIYSNGIIILDKGAEAIESPLSIKAGELYELAKHNIILLRTEWLQSSTHYFECSILQAFTFLGKIGIYNFWFSNGLQFVARTADDYPIVEKG